MSINSFNSSKALFRHTCTSTFWHVVTSRDVSCLLSWLFWFGSYCIEQGFHALRRTLEPIVSGIRTRVYEKVKGCEMLNGNETGSNRMHLIILVDINLFFCFTVSLRDWAVCKSCSSLFWLKILPSCFLYTSSVVFRDTTLIFSLSFQCLTSFVQVSVTIQVKVLPHIRYGVRPWLTTCLFWQKNCRCYLIPPSLVLLSHSTTATVSWKLERTKQKHFSQLRN